MKQKGLNNFGAKGWWIVIFVGLLYLISSATVDLLNVTPQLFQAVKGWDQNQLLVFSGIGGWVGVVLALVFGRWITAKGVKVPTVLALVLVAVLFAVNGYVPSIATYGLVVVLITALGNTLNLVSTNTYMSNWFPKKKGIALGWSTMGAPLSSAICIPIFTAVFGATHGLSAPYMVFAVITLVLALLAAFAVKSTPEEAGAYPDNDPEEAKAPKISEYKSTWSVPRLLACKQMWLVSLSFGLLFIALVSTMTQFVPRVQASGFTMEEGTLWLSIASVLGILGSYLWGVLDQKAGTKKAVMVFALYMAIMQFLLAAFINSKTVTLILIILLGILIGGICNLLPSMVIQIFGRYEFAAANSVVTPIVVAIRTSSFIILPIILFATQGSYQVLSIVLGVLSLIAFVLSIGLSNKTLEAPKPAGRR